VGREVLPDGAFPADPGLGATHARPHTELAEALLATRDRSINAAVQGTVARSEEVLLLAFDAQEEGWARR
jgi:hypothetical protein